jgi:hypothetical protein
VRMGISVMMVGKRDFTKQGGACQTGFQVACYVYEAT